MGMLYKTLLLISLLTAGAVQAHGDYPPKHGGQVSNDDEIQFEMVKRQDGLHFYASDHGDALQVPGAKGTLKVTSGKSTREFRVTSAGDRFIAKGATARTGDVAVLNVTFANGSIAHGTFKIQPVKVPTGAR